VYVTLCVAPLLGQYITPETSRCVAIAGGGGKGPAGGCGCQGLPRVPCLAGGGGKGPAGGCGGGGCQGLLRVPCLTGMIVQFGVKNGALDGTMGGP